MLGRWRFGDGADIDDLVTRDGIRYRVVKRTADSVLVERADRRERRFGLVRLPVQDVTPVTFDEILETEGR